MIVIDTNVAISIIHKKVPISGLRILMDSSKVNDKEIISITAPSMYELYFGLFKLKRRKDITLDEHKWNIEREAIEKMGELLPVLAYTHKSAMISADIYTDLISQGKEIDQFDCLIAGTALSHNYTRILTTNVNHFERIPNFECIPFPL